MTYFIMMPRAVTQVKQFRSSSFGQMLERRARAWYSGGCVPGRPVYGSMPMDARFTNLISAEDGQVTFRNGKQK